MKKRNECYLCGGKLDHGRCSLCGLDNTKAHRKNYRLNESSFEKKRSRPVLQKMQKNESTTEHAGETASEALRTRMRAASESVHKKTREASEAAHKKTGTASETANKKERRKSVSARDVIVPEISMPKRNMPKSYFKGKKTGKGALAAGIIIAVFALFNIVPLFNPLTDVVMDNVGQEDSYDEAFGDYDPYAYVERDLSEEGSTCDLSLTNGEYIVGVSLPEGSYKVELSEGSGSLNVTDKENGIYLYEAFGPDEEYEVTAMDDLRLYEGAIVEVRTVSLKLHSENAQTDALTAQDNPLTETVQLKAGESYTAGVDFPEGIYDILGAEWGDVEYSVYLGEISEDEELNYMKKYAWFSEEEWSQTYYNAVLPAGTELTVGAEDASLRPSEKVGSLDYDTYYDRYR